MKLIISSKITEILTLDFKIMLQIIAIIDSRRGFKNERNGPNELLLIGVTFSLVSVFHNTSNLLI